jgi:hypothetical protein
MVLYGRQRQKQTVSSEQTARRVSNPMNLDVQRSKLGGTISALIVLITHGFGASAAAQTHAEWPIIELRQYTLHPGARDVLIDLFEAEFVESQEDFGMKIIGTFRDLERPDRFVWIRAFKDMSSRAEALKSFYTGPVWKAHGKAAGATMIDSHNVLLLRVAHPQSGLTLARSRWPRGATAESRVLIVANIYSFERAVDVASVEFFERAAVPELEAAGIPVLATYVTETADNNYPSLPVRDDRVFVWFTQFADRADFESRTAALLNSARWKSVAERLRSKLTSPPEVLLLQPTSRSLLGR